jgi:hypothetical protein
MKRVLLVCLICLMSGNSFASPAVGLLEQKTFSKLTTAQKLTSSNTCTDFSGRWKGQCSVDGATFNLSRDIKQVGCTVLQDGSDITGIGSIKNDVQTQLSAEGKSISYSVATSATWNADQSLLQIQLSGIVGVEGYAPIAISGNGTMSLDNNKLVETFSVPYAQVSCSFDKE